MRDGATMTGGNGGHNRDLDPRLLDLLVCPLTKTRLRLDAEAGELVSEAAKLAYPIRGGVPIMLPSEARPLDGAER